MIVVIVGAIAVPIYITLMVLMVRSSRRLRRSMENTLVAAQGMAGMADSTYELMRTVFHATYGPHDIEEEP